MEKLLQDLADWGCDLEGALDRFLGEKELYLTCLHTVVTDGAFAALGEALLAGNVTEAFEHAHTLKGVLANLGLTPMYDIVVQIVEPLRKGSMEGLLPHYEALMAANQKLTEMLGD